MKLKFEDEVYLDLEQVEETIRERIMSEILDLEDNPLPDNSYVRYLPDGAEVQCLKLQEEDRNSALNHRVTMT